MLNAAKSQFRWNLQNVGFSQIWSHIIVCTHNHIEYLDSAVLTGGHNPLAVWTELQAADNVTVALVGEDAAFSSDIPQLLQQKINEASL